MKTLRLGSKGHEVGKWQYFLRGAGLYFGEVDEVFGELTREATQGFQRRHGLLEDGIAGNRTLGEAMRVGFSAVEDDVAADNPLEAPPPPSFGPLGQAGREQRFGRYGFVPTPVQGNPEAIQIQGDWVAQNIRTFTIAQLKNVPGAAAEGRAQFHRDVGPRVVELFQRWQDAGHLPLILTYGGSFVARFVRGSRAVLSPHAHGSAFDINVAWNAFGAVPARPGARGSVRPLVSIANELGFYWGGHFSKRDGMHFELAK